MIRKKPIDFIIFTLTILLTLFGLVMVYSASYYLSLSQGGEGNYYLVKQLWGALIGIVFMVVVSYIDYSVWAAKGVIPWLAVGISIALLIAVLFTDPINNVNRFLQIGPVQFQPSEIGRLSLVVFFAYWMEGKDEALHSGSLVVLLKAMWVPLAIAAVMAGLILLGKNLSMAASTLMIVLGLLIIGGMRKRFILGLMTLGATAVTLATVLEPYRMKRLLIFRDPFTDPGDSGWQLVQSIYALASGGLFGVGLGNSRQKLLYLPYRESDFILSIVGEELGFVGVVLLMAAFWWLIWRSLLVASKAPNQFGTYLASGLALLIGVQVLINLAVITSSMPPTGVPLPFISAGNTSLIVFMAAVGMILSVSRTRVRR